MRKGAGGIGKGKERGGKRRKKQERGRESIKGDCLPQLGG